MSPDPVYPRFAESRLAEALADTPVVLIHGPRQCGKTTLAQVAGRASKYAYFRVCLSFGYSNRKEGLDAQHT